MAIFQRLIYLFTCLWVLSSCEVNHLIKAEPQQYEVQQSQDLGADQAILSMLQPYKQRLDAEMNIVIGTLAMDLSLGRPESNLGNLVVDALQAKMESNYNGTLDFTVANGEGLRIPNIEAGPIKRSLIFELFPFDHIMVVLELNGELLTKLVKHMANQGGWPQSKGLYYNISADGATDIQINGASVDPTKRYAVGMPDYIANGGGNASFLRNVPQISSGKYMRDLVIDYIQEQKSPIVSFIEGRVEIIN